MLFSRSRAALALFTLVSAATALVGVQQVQIRPSVVAVSAGMPSAAPVERSKPGPLAYMSPQLIRELEQLPAGGIGGVFAHFTPDTIERRIEILKRFPLTIGSDFYPEADAVFVQGTVPTIMALAAEPGIYFIEQNEKLHYFNHTANWAIRTRVAQERVGLGPYYDAAGKVLDGTGIGVAIVDSGVDGTHGDFDDALNGGRNYRFACTQFNTEQTCTNPQFVDVGTNGTTDTSSGHGHHVAGTVLGSGFNSTVDYPEAANAPFIRGSFAGVAPKAKLYAYNTGEAIAVLTATQTFQHMVRNYDDRTIFPTPIRVVNNSYGNAAGTAYAPTSVFSQLVKQMVAKGAVVAFAAGNSGDATAADTTSGQCKDTTPGVICVGGHYDGGTGDRDSRFYSATSQGPFGTPVSYPDIAAPGEDITSTCTAALPICKAIGTVENEYQPFYGTISGTSMATPHVVGAVALLLQARPALTPEQVEDVLQDNARKVVDNVYGAARAVYIEDPQNPPNAAGVRGTTNYRGGAGLLDLPATLDALGVAKFGTLPDNVETTLIGGDANAAGGADNGSMTAVGAADLIKLTAQHENLGGTTGIRWRLTVANAAALGNASAVTYQIIGNFNGKPYSTSGILSAAGFVGDGSSSAAATNVSKAGNVLSLFVPLTALGSPPVGAPIHNLRVVVTSDASGSVAEVDYAPSRALLPTDDSSTAPGWAKPYTVLLAAAGVGGVTQNRCEVPGLTLLTDARGDSTTTDSQDILSANVAQPFAASGNPNLVFTIKVASLETLTPNSGYFVSFNTPAMGTMGVRMAVVDPTAPEFYTYVVGASGGMPPVSDGRFVDTQVAAEASSTYDPAAGTITIVAKPSVFGLAVGQSLVGFNGGVTQATDPVIGTITQVTDSMPDGLGRTGSFEFKPNAFCALNTPPVAVLAGTPNNGDKPLEVAFTGAGSTESDAGDRIVEYSFDFGDGSAFKVQAAPTINHTYTKGGTYVAKLKVKDSRGGESTSLGMVTVTVVNTKPVAVLEADKTSGAPGLTVQFSGIQSTDPNGGDAVASYSFDLDGDGSYEIADATSAMASKTYDTAGSFNAKLQVKDSEGLVSDAVSKTITVAAVTANTAPTARLTSDKASGPAPLTVVFDASTSSDTEDGANLSYSFDVGDGSGFGAYGSAKTRSHTYPTAGSYVAQVKVKDSAGLESTAAATVNITVTTVPSGNAAPTARISATPTSGTVPLAVAFDASNSSDPDAGDTLSYRFDVDGDGSFEAYASGSKASFTFNNPGSYVAKVQVKDRAGLESAPANVTITVSGVAGNRPPIAVLRAPTASVAAQSPASFDGISSYDTDGNDGVASLRFDFGDGTPAVTVVAGEVQHRYATAGSYTVTLIATDTRGATSTPVSKRVTVGPAVAATPTGPVATGTGDSGIPRETSGGATTPALLGLLGLAALLRRRPR